MFFTEALCNTNTDILVRGYFPAALNISVPQIKMFPLLISVHLGWLFFIMVVFVKVLILQTS